MITKLSRPAVAPRHRGYLLWNTLLGGITPCYSTLPTNTQPPPISKTITTTPSASQAKLTSTVTETTTVTPSVSQVKVTSTVVNVVYAMQYPVKKPASGLHTSAKAGIGAGSALAGLLALATLLFWLFRRRQRPRDPPDLPGQQSGHIPPP
ncbi:hypothetical protein GP486_005444 [Trichoglossum hirsutum]|uniref:Uncharacterized protein n=1 Tax=Trichoglossum hirsutum TaxID=265104 RepID=A0A9P8RMQ8_9PEZI|nr:hypothetical protein GP486_005444 [Trichoglossum hirsutum]